MNLSVMSEVCDDVIPPEFAFLRQDCGFRVADHGDGYADLVAGSLRIALQRDRYYPAIIISVGNRYDEPQEGNWYASVGLNSVRSVLLHTDLAEILSDAELAHFL